MKKINGIPLGDRFRLPIDYKVGVLLFQEIETTTVFVNENGEPIIKEWVDCSSDGNIDRYLFYYTTREYLKKAILGKIPHVELYNQAVNGQIFICDFIKDKEYSFWQIITLDSLPISYMPKASFFIEDDDLVDKEKISAFFDFENINEEKSFADELLNESSKKGIETINLHLLDGKGVSFGIADTRKLGFLLRDFDDFYRNVALDSLYGIGRTKSKPDEADINIVSTQVFGQKAASFSLLIKPKENRGLLYEEEYTSTGQISSTILKLIKNSSDAAILQEEYSIHSEHTLNSYIGFVKTIYEQELNLEFGWVSLSKNQFNNQRIDYKEANRIMSNFESLNVSEEIEIRIKGKFRALNCDTGSFVFFSTEETKFTGYFDKSIREGAERIIFPKIYEIVVSRKITKIPGKIDPKIEDVIVSFYEDV